MNLRNHWSLDPATTFLNHGSFGACPTAVLAEQQRLRARMERQPLQFLGRDLESLLDAARARLGALLGADPDDLAFVPNATAGVNSVLRWVKLEPGDELLLTDHGYNACKNAAAAAVDRGARLVVAQVPFPVSSPDEVVDAVLARVGPRTRLAVLDHVTSPTGLVFPLERLVRALAGRGVDTLVDGAHAPGMLPLDLGRLSAAYYTGNCHKWLCAPKGSAFLWVRRDLQRGIRPLSVSHGANSPRTDRSRFRLEFDWTGTVDPTPYLCVPAAIDFLSSLLPGGLPEVMQRNRALALRGRAILCGALGVAPPAPEEMIGSLAAVPVPDAPPLAWAEGFGHFPDALHVALQRRGIEAPVYPFPAPPKRLLRISAQLYNTPEEVERLAAAVLDELHRPGSQSPARE